jgi:hypothetical protein
MTILTGKYCRALVAQALLCSCFVQVLSPLLPNWAILRMSSLEQHDFLTSSCVGTSFRFRFQNFKNIIT